MTLSFLEKLKQDGTFCELKINDTSRIFGFALLREYDEAKEFMIEPIHYESKHGETNDDYYNIFARTVNKLITNELHEEFRNNLLTTDNCELGNNRSTTRISNIS